MASNNGGGKRPPLHPIHHHCGGYHRRRHHHIFYVSPHCPLHRPILLPNNHSPSCSFSTSYPSLQNPNLAASVSPDPQLIDLHKPPNHIFNDAQVEDEEEKLEEEEDEDPIFVLTDEWRDFFAKSDAKRRLAKKQAKKGKK